MGGRGFPKEPSNFRLKKKRARHCKSPKGPRYKIRVGIFWNDVNFVEGEKVRETYQCNIRVAQEVGNFRVDRVEVQKILAHGTQFEFEHVGTV